VLEVKQTVQEELDRLSQDMIDGFIQFINQRFKLRLEQEGNQSIISYARCTPSPMMNLGTRIRGQSVSTRLMQVRLQRQWR
jgi:hypothetical protein